MDSPNLDVLRQDPLSALREGLSHASHDPRALRILAKTIYRELRRSGLEEQDVMAIAGELLSLVAGDVKDRRQVAEDERALPSTKGPQATLYAGLRSEPGAWPRSR